MPSCERDAEHPCLLSLCSVCKSHLQANWRHRSEYDLLSRRLGEALEVLKETLDYLPYPSGMGIVSKNQARIRERVNNICHAHADLSGRRRR